MSSSASLIELLKSCGLEHRAKLFEDEGYTLDVAKTAVRDDQATLLDDLRELKLPMDECRTFMEALAAADNAARFAAAAEADAAAKKKAEADAAAKKAEAEAAAKKKAEADAAAKNPVSIKLEEHGLTQYADALGEQGYTSMASFQNMTNEEAGALADEVKMKPGHKKAFIVAFI